MTLLVSLLRSIAATYLMKQSWTFMLLPAVNHMSSNRAKIGSRTVVASLHFPSSIGIAHCSKVAMYASTGDVEKSDRGTQLAAPISNAASLTSAELMKLKVPALKELCRSRKLLVSGTKAVLVDRLLVWASNALESKPKEDVSALARPLKSTDSLKTKGINGGAGNVESSSHGADTEQPQEGDVVEVVGDNGVVYRAIWTAKQVFTKNDSGEAVPDTKLILVLDLPEPPPPLPPRSRANTDAISKLTQLVAKNLRAGTTQGVSTRPVNYRTLPLRHPLAKPTTPFVTFEVECSIAPEAAERLPCPPPPPTVGAGRTTKDAKERSAQCMLEAAGELLQEGASNAGRTLSPSKMNSIAKFKAMQEASMRNDAERPFRKHAFRAITEQKTLKDLDAWVLSELAHAQRDAVEDAAAGDSKSAAAMSDSVQAFQRSVSRARATLLAAASVLLGSKSAPNSPGSAPAAEIGAAVERWVNVARSIKSLGAPLDGFTYLVLMQRISHYGQYSPAETLLLALRDDQDQEATRNMASSSPSSTNGARTSGSGLVGRLSLRRHSDPQVVVLADHVEALATAYIQGGNAKRADALVCSLPAAVIDTASATAAASSVNANAAAAVATAVGVPKAVTSACQGVAMDAQMLSTVIGAVPWRRGLTLLREELPARNLSINAACVNAIMFKLVNARQFQDAANIFADAEKRQSSFRATSSGKNDDYAYNALTLIPALTSMGRLGDSAGIKRVVLEILPRLMQEEPSAPSSSLFDSSIDNGDDSEDLDGNQSDNNSVNTGVPKSLLRSILHSAVSALAAASRPSDALAIFDAMPNAPWHCSHDTVSFNVAIGAASRLSPSEAVVKAWELFSQLLDRSRPTSGGNTQGQLPWLAPPDRLTYSSMIAAHARAGDLDGAERLLEALHFGHDFSEARFSLTTTASSRKARGSTSSSGQGVIVHPTATACNQVLSACAEEGNWKRAVRLVSSGLLNMETVGYNIAMTTTAKAGEFGATCALYGALLDQHARSTNAGNLGGNDHDNNAVETSSASTNRRSRSSSSSERITMPGFQDSFVKQFCNQESSIKSVATLDASPDSHSKNEGPCAPDEVTFNVLLQAAASSPSHGISKAKVILDEMERITQSAPKDLRTANAFLCVCEAAGDWELAIATLNGLDHMRLDNSPNGAGINTNFKPSDALAWIPEFSPSLTPDSFSFNTALGACREAGQWNAAKELLQRMKDHGPPPDLITYNVALGVCIKAAEGRTALNLFAEMKANGLTPGKIAYECTCDALEASGLTQEAEAFFGEGCAMGVFELADSDSTDGQGVVTEVCTKLDLHGCSVARAAVSLRFHLNAHRRSLRQAVADSKLPESPAKRRKKQIGSQSEASSSAQNTDDLSSFQIVGDLVVVTGRGKHSGEEGLKLYDAAAQQLSQFGLNLRSWPRNPGRFWISKEDIAGWVAKGDDLG